MATQTDFSHSVLGRTGIPVSRLGLSASYWPGRRAVHFALDHEVNFFFGYAWDFQSVRVLRDLPSADRAKIVIATGAYNWIWTHSDIRKSLERRLRQFKTDCIDVFLFLGVIKPEQLREIVIADLLKIREEGKVRAIGLSTHVRKFAGRLAREGLLNTLMIRYNAAHRGAETDIFPHLEKHNPGLFAYTATRWGYLLRRPRHWPKSEPVPTAGQCYRFVLSNENVDISLTVPRSLRQVQQNLTCLEQGPMSEDEMAFMRRFGDTVHSKGHYFMQPAERN